MGRKLSLWDFLGKSRKQNYFRCFQVSVAARTRPGQTPHVPPPLSHSQPRWPLSLLAIASPPAPSSSRVPHLGPCSASTCCDSRWGIWLKMAATEGIGWCGHRHSLRAPRAAHFSRRRPGGGTHRRHRDPSSRRRSGPASGRSAIWGCLPDPPHWAPLKLRWSTESLGSTGGVKFFFTYSSPEVHAEGQQGTQDLHTDKNNTVVPMLPHLVWHGLPPEIPRDVLLKQDLITFDPVELDVGSLVIRRSHL